MIVRREGPGDAAAIRALTRAAFENHPHSRQTELLIVDALRAAGALALSLVAEEDASVLGHAAFSPVTIAESAGQWFGLGPVSVLPARQRRGIGSALIEKGLAQLRASGAAGCVVLGEPRYYHRFGFAREHRFDLEGVPAEYFLALAFRPDKAQGKVAYHAAFSTGTR